MAEVTGNEVPSVYGAWSKVMEEVQAITKSDRNRDQGFNFRGIDAVMNAVGPSLRRNGVIVVPGALEESSERYTTAKGTQMCNRIVKVLFTVIGPNGDSFTGATYGEAADSGDKAVSKAHSVAYRTFLLQALTIPTDEPDPDASSHERFPDSNEEGRAELRALCEEKGWPAEAVAEVFQQRFGVHPRTASNDDLKGFVALVKTGAVTIQIDASESPASA